MGPNQQKELSDRVGFSEVVMRLEKIANAKHMNTKKEILDKFFTAILDSKAELQTKFRDEVGPQAKVNFYPFLRLFVPTLDLERGAYGVQEKKLGHLYVRALSINPKGDTAKKLTNLQGNTTNYGDIVFDVMKPRSREVGKLSVYKVNEYLDLIAEHFVQNERHKIEDKISAMLRDMSALETKWLTRILLKKLNLGLGKKYILWKYHPKANDLYNQNSHLSDICELIDSGVPLDNLKSGIIELFKPIRSMLCERAHMSKINDMLSQHVYYLETKMDGERCQLHFNGTQFKYFSRQCKEDDLTRIFGATSTTGLYSPFLYHKLKGKVQNAIFDGEIMVWDREAECFLKKAENYTAKHLKSNDPRLNPCLCIYDLLYVDGVSLIDKPYAERIRKLKTIIDEQKGSLMLCERTKLRDGAHFIELFNKHFESNEEGVVIKQEDSKYRPGQREKGGWFKMKPDYENNLISDFDLLIVGGYYNDNRTAVDSFLLAVFKKTSPESDSGVFYSVCKIRNGLSRKQFTEILNELQPYRHEIKNRGQQCPPEIEWANPQPDFWIEPKKSIIVQIKASELTETTRYRTSHSFRFPRVMEIRRDKMWYDTCTLNEFQTFCSSNSKVEKLTKRQATSNDLTVDATVPKRHRGAAPKKLAAASTSNEIDVIDNVANGLDFHIVNGDNFKHLENMVKRHGGKIVAYPNSNTFVIIAPNPKSRNVIKFIDRKIWNIAKVEWLERALGSERPLHELINFTPNDMVYTTVELQEQFDAELDNDDYFETPPMNFDDRTLSADQMEANDQSNLDNDEADDDIVDIFAFDHVQTVYNEITPDRSHTVSGHDSAEQLDESSLDDDQSVVQPAVEPAILIDESRKMDQDAAQVNDSVYELDTQVIQPVTHDQIPDQAQANNENAMTTESAETKEDCNPDEMFSSCVAYFYQEESAKIDSNQPYAEFLLMDGGGMCLNTPDEIQKSSSRLTHIFLSNDDFDHAKLKQIVESFGTEKIENIVFMRYQWLLDCNDQKKRICDTSYKVDL